MTGPYHHSGGSILHSTGRLIDYDEAEGMIREWAARAVLAQRYGFVTFARFHARSALSLGEAWIAARDWRAAA